MSYIIDGCSFFVKVSRQGFSKIIKKNIKTRLRLRQVVLFCMYYAETNGNRFGGVRKSGRNYGVLCYDRCFIKRIRGWSGLSRAQLYRYLQELRQHSIIFRDGDFLRFNSRYILFPDRGQSFFCVPLSGMGGKGIDINRVIEGCFKLQSHPNSDNHKFNTLRQTESYRRNRHNLAVSDFEKRKKVRHVWIRIQYVLNLKNKNTNSLFKFKSGYQGNIDLRRGPGPPLKVCWTKTKIMSEYEKRSCSMSLQDKGLFVSGSTFERVKTEKMPVYRWAPKPVKINDEIPTYDEIEKIKQEQKQEWHKLNKFILDQINR